MTFVSQKKISATEVALIFELAEPTGLEPATSDVTGRRSNQLNYDSAKKPEFSKATAGCLLAT
jgi:hypothetical protein